MSNPAEEYVVIGKIGATYGVKGWLKITSFTDPLHNILQYAPWFISDPQHPWQLIQVTEGRPHGKGIVVKFAGIDNPEQARLMTGKAIGAKRSQLPILPKDEFYWADLEGLTVINQRGETLGTVIYVMATGANDVLVVKGQKEIAIPYLPEVIKKIDLSQRLIQVDWEFN